MENVETSETSAISRGKIAMRLLYTVLFLIIFEILKTIVQVIALFQYIILFITKAPNTALRNVSNKISSYAYRVLRYVTLLESQRPYPFTKFPEELHPAEEEVVFD